MRQMLMHAAMAAALLLPEAVGAAPRSYVVPEDSAALLPGPNQDVAQQNCSACHSADYISTQPPMRDPHAFWQGEVTKMIKAYGAPIDGADVPTIVDYLSATYGGATAEK